MTLNSLFIVHSSSMTYTIYFDLSNSNHLVFNFSFNSTQQVFVPNYWFRLSMEIFSTYCHIHPFLLVTIPSFVFTLSFCNWCVTMNRRYKVDFILLAGYLKLVPIELVQAYPRSILNIHPSLLPAFGGKGYYGMKVHQAVIASGARYAQYSFIFQLSCL